MRKTVILRIDKFEFSPRFIKKVLKWKKVILKSEK